LGDSSAPDAMLSADAVRIGGGRGDVLRAGETTGRPRWEDGGILATQWNSAPPAVYDPSFDGNGSDPSSRSRWAAWEHPSGEDAVYLSWHSNAGGGTGTSTYTYEGSRGPAADGSWELGELLQEELVAGIRAQWDSDWTSRGHRTAAFSEVSPAHNDEMPAALVELAFHDHPGDVEFLKDPAFRRDAARAMTRAIIRYFAERDGDNAVFPPEPPRAAAVLHDRDGALVASWSDGPTGAPFGGPPTSWVVQTSTDGRSWANGIETASRSLRLPVALGDTIYVRISARNAGGDSFPTEVLGGRRSPDGSAVALVVPAFDRLETSLLPWVDLGGAVGEVRRGDLRFVNRFDGVVAHGTAITDAGWYWESASDEALPALVPGDWPLVVWAAGEESTQDEAYSASQQMWIRSHRDAGGALWSSGAEVLWDLDHRGDADDAAFASQVLGATMAADDAGSSQVVGEGPWAGLALDFGSDHGDMLPVEFPDVLETARSPIARYASGGIAAAIGDGVLHMGFPFETIADSDARAAAAAAVLPQLVPGHTPPELPGDDGSQPADPGGDSRADTASGRTAGRPGARGCGCTSQPGSSAYGLPALALLALARRRP
ncbi:MAG: N-acetylmuramoyl-L-alanine amidase, partial [Myxococcota bacterium]|nr:N-acetylmuramoyl-L-alanine amidase [Myxococcota bacterium]